MCDFYIAHTWPLAQGVAYYHLWTLPEMDTWAAELEHRLEALEIDASLHTPAQDEENSDEEQPKGNKMCYTRTLITRVR